MASNPHKMVQYLLPFQLFRESTKKPGTVFLGLSFIDEFVSLAISDHGYLTSRFYYKFPKDEILLDYLLAYVQSLQKELGYRLEGIIVANRSSVIIRNLMDNLCEKGKFETLSYTCWEHNLTYYGTRTIYSAQHMLEAFLHHCNTLLCNNVEEREDSEREEHHRMTPVSLGLSFSDDCVSLAIPYYNGLTARFVETFPIGDSLLDNLVDVVRRRKRDAGFDLEGIVVAYSSSTDPPLLNIDNLMDGLCKKGKFESLKFRFFEHKISSEVFLLQFNKLLRNKTCMQWRPFDSENRFKICYSSAEHKYLKPLLFEEYTVQYLEPLKLFRECRKGSYYTPLAVFLGLSISDKYVSLATSDRYYSDACFYGIYPIDDESLLDKLLDSVLRLKIDCNYDLLGIVVANRSSKKNPPSLEIDDLMDSLCKKGRFKSLKYTSWEDDCASRNALFDYHGSEWKTFPLHYSIEWGSEQEDFERSSADYMLGAYLKVCKTLLRDKDFRKRRKWSPRDKRR